MFTLKSISVILVIIALAVALGLFWWSRKSKSHKARYLSLAIALVSLVVVVLFLIGLFKFADILAFVWVFSIFTDKLASLTGWSRWLNYAVAIILSALVIWAFSFVLSLKKNRRQLGYGLLLSLAVLMCLGMFVLSKDIYFNCQTGAPQKWYTVTPEDGYRTFDEPGYDTKWGIQRQLITPEIQRKIELEKSGRIKVPSGQEEIYFDMITGKPIQWYYQAEDGSYEFFFQSGTHPKYGVDLQPVTPEVVKDAEAKKLKAQSEMGKLEKKLKDEEVKTKQLEEEKVALQEQNKQLQERFDKYGQEVQKQEEKDKQIIFLQTENEILKKNLEAVSDDNKSLEDKLINTKKERDNLAKEKTNLTLRLEELKWYKETVAETIAGLEKRLEIKTGILSSKKRSVFFKEDFSNCVLGRSPAGWSVCEGLAVLKDKEDKGKKNKKDNNKEEIVLKPSVDLREYRAVVNNIVFPEDFHFEWVFHCKRMECKKDKGPKYVMTVGSVVIELQPRMDPEISMNGITHELYNLETLPIKIALEKQGIAFRVFVNELEVISARYENYKKPIGFTFKVKEGTWESRDSFKIVSITGVNLTKN